MIDGDGRLVASNVAWQHFAKKIGIPEECVVTGSDYLSCCDEAARRGIESAGQLAALLREIIQGKYPSHDFEFRCPYSDEELWFLTRITRFPGGGAVRIVIAHENITSIKVSQRQVEQSQQEFQNLFEFAPDATLMVDADGIILRVNRQLEQVFDYSRSDLVGQSLQRLVPGGAVCQNLLAACRQGQPVTLPGAGILARRKDGSTLPVEISVSLLSQGTVAGSSPCAT